MDNITRKRIDMLHPKLRDETHEMYTKMCDALIGRAMPRFAYTLRTIKEQNELYQKGRTTPGPKVTNAKGGQSYHNYGLAFDLVLIIDGKTASWDTLKDFDNDKVSDWNECVLIAKKYGWEWGGDWVKFPDKPHFQKTFGKSIAELLVAPKFKQDNIEYPLL
jgi:peptidoglycan L-alanyl-D-glutamate endopeptidase CwlK